jgi:anti-sigma factor RsiW
MENQAVAPERTLRHLTAEQIQELLDRGLAPGEEPAVQEHLAACARCQSEVEAWHGLFAGLGSLAALDPGPAFSVAVMERVPLRRPLPARIRGWLGARSRVPGGLAVHVPVTDLQDYLEGVLPTRRSSRVEAHLAACGGCRRELAEWEGLADSLAALGRLGPTAGFGERVMTQLRRPVPVPVPFLHAFPRRVVAWARSLLPRTRKGWATVAGVASAPTITLAALGFELFSRPLLSAEAFLTYLAWKASDLSGALLSAAGDALLESVAVFRVYTLLESASASPLLVGMGGLALSLLSTGSIWVLYKNLLTTPPREGHHAHAQV